MICHYVEDQVRVVAVRHAYTHTADDGIQYCGAVAFGTLVAKTGGAT